jgi:hypothetical protein
MINKNVDELLADGSNLTNFKRWAGSSLEFELDMRLALLLDMKQNNVMTSRRKFTTVSKLLDCP